MRACEGRGCLQRITPSAARLPALPESEVHTAVWAATRGAPGRVMCRIEPRLNPSQPTASRKVPTALSAEEWPRSSLGGWSLALNRPARGPTILAPSRATTPFWREGQGGEGACVLALAGIGGRPRTSCQVNDASTREVIGAAQDCVLVRPR